MCFNVERFFDWMHPFFFSLVFVFSLLSALYCIVLPRSINLSNNYDRLYYKRLTLGSSYSYNNIMTCARSLIKNVLLYIIITFYQNANYYSFYIHRFFLISSFKILIIIVKNADGILTVSSAADPFAADIALIRDRRDSKCQIPTFTAATLAAPRRLDITVPAGRRH